MFIDAKGITECSMPEEEKGVIGISAPEFRFLKIKTLKV